MERRRGKGRVKVCAIPCQHHAGAFHWKQLHIFICLERSESYPAKRKGIQPSDFLLAFQVFHSVRFSSTHNPSNGPQQKLDLRSIGFVVVVTVQLFCHPYFKNCNPCILGGVCLGAPGILGGVSSPWLGTALL